MVRLHFDGACEPRNPGGHGGWGAWISGIDEMDPVGLCGYIGCGDSITNNVAEYTALVEGLKYLLERDVERCHVCGDSQLVIMQMTGRYKVKSLLLRPYWEEAQEYASRFRRIRFKWVPREANRQADLWSRYGLMCSVLDKARDVVNTYRIETNGGDLWRFHNPKSSTYVWEVRRDRTGRYSCTCPAYAQSRIGVCKHATAAWIMDFSPGGVASYIANLQVPGDGQNPSTALFWSRQ